MNTTEKRKLYRIIQESVRNALNEGELEEGFWDNLEQGAKAFFGKGDAGSKNKSNQALRSQNGGLNLKKRWDSAKTNFQMKNNTDKTNELMNAIMNAVDNSNGNITLKSTVEQLINHLGGKKLNYQTTASKAQNNIYR